MHAPRTPLLLVVVAIIVSVTGCFTSGAPTAAPGGSPTPGASGPSAAPSFVRPTPTPRPTFASYIVRTGDSLTSIARQFGTTPRSIAFWNRASYPSLDPESPDYAPDRIGVGWTLVVIPDTIYDPADAPSPSPDASDAPAAPTPRPSSAPSPSAAPSQPIGSSTVISHGPRGTTRVALTFDMGGRLDPAVAIMDWLVAHEVHATIFPTGKSGTETEIGRQVLGRVRDHPELFELANHSWDHPNFTELTAAQMADQLTRTESALAERVGRTSKPWFRPPYGAWNKAVRDAVGAAGWQYTVMWDVDTIDWRPTSDGGPTARDIEAKVLSQAEGGSIVLMHLGGWHTLDALPAIIAGLEARDLEPATLSGLLGG